MSKKASLTPYEIWYFGAFLDRLIAKLDASLRTIVFISPDIREELDALTRLKIVEGFEGIGGEVEKWKFKVLDINSCRMLYQRSIIWRDTFMQEVNRFLLIRPSLHILSMDNLVKSLTALPDDDRVKEWLQKDHARVIEFLEAVRSLLYGLPTAAGFYLIRLCERSLRDLYIRETGNELGRKTWGAILDELADYYKDKQRPRIFDLISYLKTLRDKIAHPEKILSQKDAEELYLFTLRVIRELDL
jgi:hypothetical protein